MSGPGTPIGVRTGEGEAGAGPTNVATADATATVRPAARLRGELRMPGDKSISHRALFLAALAEAASAV